MTSRRGYPAGIALAAAAVLGLGLTCHRPDTAAGPPVCGGGGTRASPGDAALEAAAVGPGIVLRQVADVPLPGPAVRFDYQSVDTAAHRLYVAHMNAGTLLVFDTRARRVVADLAGFPSVHGVLAVPELGKVYATVTGRQEVAVVDATTLRTTARLGRVGYPDGLAYAPGVRRIYVSDESRAGRELVIDATDGVRGAIELGGEAGNTLYDPGSGCILVAVQTRDEFVAIDPRADSIIGRYPLPGSDHPHGLAVDAADRLLFVASEGNATLQTVDLRTMRVLSNHRVGGGPDVLAFDPTAGRLYVAAESGILTVFHLAGRDLVPDGSLRIPHAHTVAVDPASHLVYLPLENVGGRPVLRVLSPDGP